MVLRSNPDWKRLQGASGEPVIVRGADIRPLGIPWLIGIFPKLLTCWDRGLSQSNCVTAGTMCNQHNEHSYVWRPLRSFHAHCLESASPGLPSWHLSELQGKTCLPHTKGLLRGLWVNWKTYTALSQLVSFHSCKIACLLIWISTQPKKGTTLTSIYKWALRQGRV